MDHGGLSAELGGVLGGQQLGQAADTFSMVVVKAAMVATVLDRDALGAEIFDQSRSIVRAEDVDLCLSDRVEEALHQRVQRWEDERRINDEYLSAHLWKERLADVRRGLEIFDHLSRADSDARDVQDVDDRQLTLSCATRGEFRLKIVSVGEPVSSKK